MRLHDDFLGMHHQPGEALLLFVGDQLVFLSDGYGQPGGKTIPRFDEASVGGKAADGDEATRSADHRFGDVPDPTIGRHHQVERPLPDCLADCLAKMRIAVNVLHFVGRLRDLVGPPMEDRDAIAPISEPVHDEVPGGPRSANDERTHPASIALLLRRDERSFSSIFSIFVSSQQRRISCPRGHQAQRARFWLHLVNADAQNASVIRVLIT
jgi:hypothetical protein